MTVHRRWARGAALLLLLALALAGVYQRDVSGAAFSASTETSANSVAAATLTGPTGIGQSSSCTSATGTPSLVDAAWKPVGTSKLVIPAGTELRDALLLNVVGTYDGAGVPSPPSGWTLLRSWDSGGSPFRFNVLWGRRAGSSDAGTSVLLGSAYGAHLLVVRAGTLPTGTAVLGVGGVSDSTATTPSVLGAAGNLLLAMFAFETIQNSFSQPPGMTLFSSYGAAGVAMSMASAKETLTASGWTGTRTTMATDPGMNYAMAAAVAKAALPQVALTWGQTASTFATGYEITRNGVVVANPTPRTATTWTDNAPPDGTNTYTIRSMVGTWRSAGAVTATSTISGC